MTNIDTLSLNIVELLQEDGTFSNTEIAQRLGISEATVRRRRKQLVNEDVVRVVGVANPFKLGFNLMVIFGIQTDKNKLKEIEQVLANRIEVRFLGVTLGKYDLMLEAWFKSSDELLEFATETLSSIEGIINTEEFQIMRLSKYAYDWGKMPSAHQALITKIKKE
jgi:Lrp/AsnC family transcriptional regulator for asnA, asnC and gidA